MYAFYIKKNKIVMYDIHIHIWCKNAMDLRLIDY